MLNRMKAFLAYALLVIGVPNNIRAIESTLPFSDKLQANICQISLDNTFARSDSLIHLDGAGTLCSRERSDLDPG